MTLKIIHLEKMVHSPAVSAAGAQFSADLLRRGLARYPWAWGDPALAAVSGDRCVGFISYQRNDDLLEIEVSGAWVEAGHDQVLARLLIALRGIVRGGRWAAVTFGHHVDNQTLAKAAKALGARPTFVSFRLDFPAQSKGARS